MKVIDIPKSGKSGGRVYYRRRRSQCYRAHVIPRDPRSPAQRRARKAFGAISKAWRKLLTEIHRQAWLPAAAKVSSRPRLAQSGPLTGHMHFEGINSARARIGKALLLWPPEPVVFGPSPVEAFTISCDHGQLRLRLAVSGPVSGDFMVFGQAPCSAGWKKWRHGAYLGLLPTPVAGECDITEMYLARFGEPKPGQRVFIRTRQQVNGWESPNHDTNALLTPKPVAAAQSETVIPPLESALPSRCQLGPLPQPAAQPHESVQIPFVSPATAPRYAVHQGPVPNQYRISSQSTPMQCRRATGGRRVARAVRLVCRTRPLRQPARFSPSYELRHHS